MRYDPEVRNKIVREYRLSGEDQEAFCARIGIPTRTLRAWLAGSRPEGLSARAVGIVQKAIAELVEIQRMMEAAGGSRPRADTCNGGPEPTESCADRQQASAAKTVEDADVVDQASSQDVSVTSTVAEGSCGMVSEPETQVVVPLQGAEHTSPIPDGGERQIAAAAECAPPPAAEKKRSFFYELDWEA